MRRMYRSPTAATREQVAAIVDATGTAAIRSELSEALSEFLQRGGAAHQLL